MSGTTTGRSRTSTSRSSASKTSNARKASNASKARTSTRSSSSTTTRSRSAPATKPPKRSDRDRFQARRLEVERRQGLRRLRLVLGLAAVTSVAVAVVAFVNSSWFDVDDVTVAGNERAASAAIVDASGIRIGQGLLEVDLDAAARSVELVPWVGTASVSRSWTGSIEISVVERPPSAVIPAVGGFALVDDHGRQLEIVERRPEGYLPITGIEGSGVAGEPAPDAILPVVALAEALPEEIVQRVSAIALIGADIHLELVDGGRANLGDGVDLGPKLQAFETVLARVDLTCLDTIDVRVPDAPVVTRTADLPPIGQGLPGATGIAAGEEPDSAPVDC